MCFEIYNTLIQLYILMHLLLKRKKKLPLNKYSSGRVRKGQQKIFHLYQNDVNNLTYII